MTTPRITLTAIEASLVRPSYSHTDHLLSITRPGDLLTSNHVSQALNTPLSVANRLLSSLAKRNLFILVGTLNRAFVYKRLPSQTPSPPPLEGNAPGGFHASNNSRPRPARRSRRPRRRRQ